MATSTTELTYSTIKLARCSRASLKMRLASLGAGFDSNKDGRVKDIHTIEDIHAHVESRRRWRVLREGIRGLARESIREILVDGFSNLVGKAETDCGEELVMEVGRMGHSCASEVNGPNATTQMALASCIILGRAHELGYLNLLKQNYDVDFSAHMEGRFWLARAKSHWRVFTSQGKGAGSGELAHLNYCLSAWDEALKFMATTVDPSNWHNYALANVARGNFDVAAQAFGTILKNFSSYNSCTLAVLCSSLYKALGFYDQCIAYMFSAISMGAEAPYDSIDLAFLLARCHEEKAAAEGGLVVEENDEDVDEDGENENENKKQTTTQSHQIAIRAYSAVFDQLKQLEDGNPQDPATTDDTVVDPKRIANHSQSLDSGNGMVLMRHNTCAKWLEDHNTWVHFGDVCSSAGHDVIAADLYEQGMQRLNTLGEIHIDKPLLGIKLAKCLRRCGQHEKAVDAITTAIANQNLNKGVTRGASNNKPKSKGKVRENAAKDTSTKLVALRKCWMGAGEKVERQNRRSINVDGTMVYKKASALPLLTVLEKFVAPPISREEDLELKELRNLSVRKASEGKWKFLRRRLKESARIQFAKEYVSVLRDKKNTKGMKKQILVGVFESEEVSELAKAL